MTLILSVVTVALVTTTGTSWAQEALTAKLDPTGLIEVSRGEVELAKIELSAHGPGWQHAPQDTATAEISDLPDADGKLVVGALPVPNTDNGAIAFTQRVAELPEGLRLQYHLSMTQIMRLNGLQVSLLMPVERYAGSEVVISQPHGDPEITGLPEQQPPEGRFQLWSDPGSKIEIARDSDDAITIELRAATDIVMQDLRQWEHEVFEVRFPAIMDDEPREVSTEDRFRLDLIVTFASPVKLTGP